MYARGSCSREIGDGEGWVLVEVLRLDEALEQIPAHGGCFIGVVVLKRLSVILCAPCHVLLLESFYEYSGKVGTGSAVCVDWSCICEDLGILPRFSDRPECQSCRVARKVWFTTIFRVAVECSRSRSSGGCPHWECFGSFVPEPDRLTRVLQGLFSEKHGSMLQST